MLGPAIGGIAAGLTGNPTTPFWLASIFVFAAGVLVWRARQGGAASGKPATGDGVDGRPPRRVGPPHGCRNLVLVAALVLGVGSYFAGGAYEVVWSLYLTSLGASLGMIGLTFFTFALPILVLSPVMGRFIDHEGGFLRSSSGRSGSACPGCCTPSCRASGSSSSSASSRARRSRSPSRHSSCSSRGRRPPLARPPPRACRRGRDGRDDHRLAERRVSSPRSTCGCRSGHRGRVAARARDRAAHRPAAPVRRHPADHSRSQRPRRRQPGRDAVPDRDADPRPGPLTNGRSTVRWCSRGGAAAARRAHNPKVGGSNPSPATNSHSPRTPGPDHPGVLLFPETPLAQARPCLPIASGLT